MRPKPLFVRLMPEAGRLRSVVGTVEWVLFCLTVGAVWIAIGQVIIRNYPFENGLITALDAGIITSGLFGWLTVHQISLCYLPYLPWMGDTEPEIDR